MFCSKCGTPNADNAAFCAGCGSPLSAAQPTPQPSSKLKSSFFNAAPDLNSPVNASQPLTPPTYSPPTPNPYESAPPATNPYTQPATPCNPYAQPTTPYAQPSADPYGAYAQPAPYGYEQPAPKKKKLLPWIIGGGVAVVAIVVLIIVLVGGKGGASNPEDAALNFVKAVCSGDYDDVCDAMYPDIADELDEDDFDEIISYLGDVKVSNYSVEDKEHGEKSDRTKYEKQLKKYDVEIDDLYYVEIAFDVEMLGYSNSTTVEVVVAKIDGRWYVISSSSL